MALSPGWESLPNDVLDSILDSLISIEDCIRFSAVCRTWRCVAVDEFRQIRGSNRHDRLHQQQLPLLMFPADYSQRSNRRLYSLIQKRFFDFQLPAPYTRFCGSSHGWLIMLGDAFKVTLFNPFSGEIITLPPIRRLAFEKRFREEISEIMWRGKEYERELREEYGEEEETDEDEEEEEEEEDEDEEEDEEDFLEDEGEGEGKGKGFVAEEEEVLRRREYSIVKGVLSADPTVNSKEYILMVIYGSEQRLAFIKSGDKDWTYIDGRAYSIEYHYETDSLSPPPPPTLWHMRDIIFHKQRFYVLYFMGQLLTCDVSNIDITGLKVKMMTTQDRLGRPFGKAYLVESLEGGELLRVLRIYDSNKVTKGFKVYKLVECRMHCEWIEVTSLGNFALFLGDNHSISILASDYPGCEPNSIYFCWDHVLCSHRRLKGPHDIGVFNLEDGMVVKNYTLDCSHGPMPMPPPIWILPTFM